MQCRFELIKVSIYRLIPYFLDIFVSVASVSAAVFTKDDITNTWNWETGWWISKQYKGLDIAFSITY